MVRASVTAGGEAVLLVTPQEGAVVLEGRDEGSGGVMFPRSRAKEKTSVGVVMHDGGRWREVAIDELQVAHPQVQVLPGGDVLIVGSRCRRHKDGEAERNAVVFRSDGSLLREMVFGDGIQDVRVSGEGKVWVSYFDEGIFGNFGWGNIGDEEPIGASGLVCFSAEGEREWSFDPVTGLKHMADCYALNVDDDAVWAHYYTQFPLVRIGRDREIQWWSTEVEGAGAIAVSGTRVLFFGPYTDDGKDRTECVLGEMRGKVVETVARYRLELPDGEGERLGRVVGQGAVLHAFTDESWYQVDVREL